MSIENKNRYISYIMTNMWTTPNILELTSAVFGISIIESQECLNEVRKIINRF